MGKARAHRRRKRYGSRKKAGRSKSRAKVATYRVPTSISGPFATRVFVPMRFEYTANLSQTGLYTALYFDINSAYQLDPSTGTHQPYGYDQYTAIYQRYRVWRGRCHLQFVNTGTVPVIIGTHVYANALAALTWAQVTERPGFFQKTAVSSEGGGKISMKRKWGLAKLQGQTKTEFAADDANDALNNASPGNICNMRLYFNQPNAAAWTGFVQIRFNIYVEWYDPLSFANS